MNLHVVVLDPSGPADAVRPWSDGLSRVAVMGSAAAPMAARNLASAGAERVILLARQRDKAMAGLVANVISGALPHVAVTRLHTRSSLLGATAIALQGTRAVDVPATTQLSMIERSIAGSISGAWLKRVTRLASPSPSFGQHLRSLLPGGSGFVALCGAKDEVVKAAPSGFATLGRAGRLLVGSSTGAPVDHLVRWYGGGDHTVVESLASNVQGLYGNQGQEFVLLEPELAAPAPVTGTCPVCDLPVHDRSCRFCHVRPRSAQELSA